MIVTSDFECGNGKDIRQLEDRHFIVTERGDKITYCYYFNVEVKAESADDAGDVMIEIIGDPDIRHEGQDVGTAGLMGHTPTNIWYTRWGKWRALPPSRVEFTTSSIRASVPVYHDDPVRVTNVIPASLTDTTRFLEDLAERAPEHCEFLEIGASSEGRPFPALHITEGLEGAGKPRFAVFSGQHPIEFPGVWGTRGIADFLTSHLPEAREYRQRFNVTVMPLVNPDGTVAGNNNFNIERQEVMSFEGAAEGTLPDVIEARSLWEFLDGAPPQLMLNIHCYCGWGGFVEPPYNGLYILKDEYFQDEARLRRQKVIEDFARFRTTGLSGHNRPAVNGPASVHSQMARKHGTMGVLFEINAGNHGPWGCGREAVAAFRALCDGYIETE